MVNGLSRRSLQDKAMYNSRVRAQAKPYQSGVPLMPLWKTVEKRRRKPTLTKTYNQSEELAQLFELRDSKLGFAEVKGEEIEVVKTWDY